MTLPASVSEFLDALVQIRGGERQRAFIEERSPPLSPEFVQSLAERIRPLLNTDPDLAGSLTHTLSFAAEREGQPLSLAFAHRGRGHVLLGTGRNLEAAEEYRTASAIFAEEGAELEHGRTLVAEAENLNYLGRYAEAETLAARARDILLDQQDVAYLSRVYIALGNLLHRQNRIAEALQEYDRARLVAEENGDHAVVAAIEANRGLVLTESNRLEEAIAALHSGRAYCTEHKVTAWDEAIDGMLADLHFKRGAYSEALRDLDKVRVRYRERGDRQRLAKCEMMRAEVCLQLNLARDAEELSERARTVFEKLSIPSEAAHCLAISGSARAELGDRAGAADRLRGASAQFLEIGDTISAAGTDLQLARLLQSDGDHRHARELALRAAGKFDAAGFGVRAAYARMVAAHSLRTEGHRDRAVEEAELALDSLEGYHAQWVSYQCRDLLGLLYADTGRLDRAEALYREAVAELESLRGNIRLDEFRMSFGRDKYQVYEHFVKLKLTTGDDQGAFDYAERSKSRTLIDLLEKNTDSIWLEGGRSGEEEHAILALRRRLNGLYSQLSEVGTTVSAMLADRGLQDAIRAAEAELLTLMRKKGSLGSELVALETGTFPGLDDIRQVLEPGEILLEYYVVDEEYCVFAVTRDDLAVFTGLATTAEVRAHVKGLGLQLSKFDFGKHYVEVHASQMQRGVEHHLRALHRLLIEPLRRVIEGRSLVVVPHRALHYVPFHALWDGTKYVIDDHEVVYAASASVLRICRRRPESNAEGDLILAVPDPSAPSIAEEARVLERLIPGSEVLVGDDATSEALRERGAHCRRIHIAAHGVFRSDNPMFSSLRLGDGWLDLMGIFSLRLGADLTTLSACETGMNALYGGDELMGLTRGFLYAGTPSLVVSLWRVNDDSTAGLMERFYAGLLAGHSKPRSLREAMLYVREKHPHPYYWAPFVLMGRS